jgi:UDPglucose--hexose-1-phosphate uridylyltransferase
MDFQFLQDPISKKWISLSPRRAKRPDEAKGDVTICPFCPGREKEEPDVYRVGGKELDDRWQIRVIPNKFPFAPIHEVIIHSPDHHKSFGELPISQIEVILQTYRQRYNTHKDKGQVYIFNNTGVQGGESLPHPHSQLVVVPPDVALEVLEWHISDDFFIYGGLFRVGCPQASQWPDEVWFVPNQTGKTFGDISDEEIASLADGLDRLVRIYDHRYGHEFPFNFYIRPGLDWYLRLIPRVKNLGGFEVGTGVYVNTQDPKETVAFLQEHWENPDFEKIKTHHQATYGRHV